MADMIINSRWMPTLWNFSNIFNQQNDWDNRVSREF